MKITRFNVRIEIQKTQPIQDAIGNWEEGWTFLYGCYAAVDSRRQSAGEIQVAGMTVDHSDLIFTIRYTSRLKGLSPSQYRLKFQNDYYDIQQIDWMNYQNETIKIYAKKVER